jgi:hypothetical protein
MHRASDGVELSADSLAWVPKHDDNDVRVRASLPWRCVRSHSRKCVVVKQVEPGAAGGAAGGGGRWPRMAVAAVATMSAGVHFAEFTLVGGAHQLMVGVQDCLAAQQPGYDIETPVGWVRKCCVEPNRSETMKAGCLAGMIRCGDANAVWIMLSGIRPSWRRAANQAKWERSQLGGDAERC